MSVRAESSEGPTWEDAQLPYMAIGRTQVLAGSQPEISVPLHLDLFIGQLTTWQQASLKTSQKRKMRRREEAR